MEPSTFAESEVRDAERLLEAALEAGDWVSHYTADAVFDGGGEHAVVGRESLLAMAASMRPLRSVSLQALRTEGRDGLAAVWCRATWVSGDADQPHSVDVRGLLVWRKEPDGVWRIAMEHIG
jgi:ketosteroid isomerase-like protein